MKQRREQYRGFTAIEVLVVVGVVSVLLALLLPAVNRIRRQARTLVSANNQRQIVSVLTLYSGDNRGDYPDSVATLRHADSSWVWQDPRMMVSCRTRSPRIYRSMATYLKSYLENPSVLQCPCVPQGNVDLEDAWQRGEVWENPATGFADDPLFGTYLFLWHYTGFSKTRQGPLHGPRDVFGRPNEGQVLVSDYLGYAHHLSPDAFSSCQPFAGASLVHGTEVFADFWTTSTTAHRPDPQLNAGYIDGHVARFRSQEALPMEVALSKDGRSPFPSDMGVGPGEFYLPPDILP